MSCRWARKWGIKYLNFARERISFLITEGKKKTCDIKSFNITKKKQKKFISQYSPFLSISFVPSSPPTFIQYLYAIVCCNACLNVFSFPSFHFTFLLRKEKTNNNNMRYTGESSWSRMRLFFIWVKKKKNNNLQSAAHEASFVYTLPSARVHANFFLSCVFFFYFLHCDLFVYHLATIKYKFNNNFFGLKIKFYFWKNLIRRTMCGTTVDDGLKKQQHELILFNVTYENFKISYSFMVNLSATSFKLW